MKKYIFLVSFLITFFMFSFITDLFAQKDVNALNDLNALLEDFNECSSRGIGASAFQVESYKDIEPNLAWRTIQEKNEFMKPGEFPVHPVAQFKINDKVVVIISSDGKIGEVIAHFVSVSTYNLQTGKMIASMKNIAGFGGKAGSSCMMDISEDKKIFTFSSVSSLGSVDKIELEITSNGNIK